MSGIEAIGDHTFCIADGTQVTAEKAGQYVRHTYDFGDGHRLVYLIPAEVAIATRDAYNKALPPLTLRDVHNVYPLPGATPGGVAS